MDPSLRPDTGDRRNGRILVCQGDDYPDDWIDWLEPPVREFENLKALADRKGLELDVGDGFGTIDDVMEFCVRLGIEFESEPWEGVMISGVYQWGWLDETHTGKAVRTATRILGSLRESLEDSAGE
jgi:hypothetical protein